jgi:hypothetical protein
MVSIYDKQRRKKEERQEKRGSKLSINEKNMTLIIKEREKLQGTFILKINK